MGGKSKAAGKTRGSAKQTPKPKTSKAKAKAKPKSKEKPSKLKRASAKKPTRVRATKPAIAEPVIAEPAIDESTDGVVQDEVAAVRTGPIKRLARGVGSFFAKMTGRSKAEDATDADATGADRTMELQADQIITQQPIEAATPRRPKKPPPVPGK